MEEGYWTEEHLLYQIINKGLPISESLYPGYELLFLFDNATSFSIFAKNVLEIAQMNKEPGRQQLFIRAVW